MQCIFNLHAMTTNVLICTQRPRQALIAWQFLSHFLALTPCYALWMCQSPPAFTKRLGVLSLRPNLFPSSPIPLIDEQRTFHAPPRIAQPQIVLCHLDISGLKCWIFAVMARCTAHRARRTHVLKSPATQTRTGPSSTAPAYVQHERRIFRFQLN